MATVMRPTYYSIPLGLDGLDDDTVERLHRRLNVEFAEADVWVDPEPVPSTLIVITADADYAGSLEQIMAAIARIYTEVTGLECSVEEE